MHRLKQQPFYLAFTEGWGDEPIIRCEPITQSTENPRLVICAVEPPIMLKNTVVLYDRFSEGSWLPISDEAPVGVLLGEIDADKEPDLSELKLAFWATVFADVKAAELARDRLRPA
jgi:hypothetical protein